MKWLQCFAISISLAPSLGLVAGKGLGTCLQLLDRSWSFEEGCAHSALWCAFVVDFVVDSRFCKRSPSC